MTLVRRSVLGVLGSVLVLVGIGGAMAAPVLAAGDANRPACSPESEASSGFRTYLPDCRAFESLTPPYKQGGVIELRAPTAVAADGDHVIAIVAGGFAGSGNYEFMNLPAYKFTRSETGWQTTALTPPTSLYPHSSFLAASPESLDTTLWGLGTTEPKYHSDIYLRDASGQFNRVGPGVAPDIRAEELKSEAQELALRGASADLSHDVFTDRAFNTAEVTAHNGHTGLWPGDTTAPEGDSLYEYDYHGRPLLEPLLVGVENQEPLKSNIEARLISDCGTILGSPGAVSHAVSDDGKVVFFTAQREQASACTGPTVDRVYARVNGSKTVAISEPSAKDCESCNTSGELQDATFQGATATGERAFFTTSQPLIPGQEGTNIYKYDFGGPTASPEHPLGKISLVSAGIVKPEVQGVVRISDDGSRVYFVAKGVLTKGSNQRGVEPIEGADNLYVYEPSEEGGGSKVAFVATLLTPEEEATLTSEEEAEATEVSERASAKGTAAFEEALRDGASFKEAFAIDQEVFLQTEHALVGTLGPSGTLPEDTRVWQGTDERPAQATAGSGRFLVFPSSAHLTPGDESKVPQLFEYDAASGALSRVSISHGANFRNQGNVSTFNLAPHLPAQLFLGPWLPTSADTNIAISHDGTRVYFTSAAGLTPQAELDDRAIFAYEAGDVSLISGGADGSEVVSEPTVQLLGADATGRNVFFRTAQALTQGDPDHQSLLYDAREDGGFVTPAGPPGCSEEACRGAAGGTPELASPGSQSVTGEEAPHPDAKNRAQQPAANSRVAKLAKALRRCRAQRNRARRHRCERQARRRYTHVTAAFRHAATTRDVSRRPGQRGHQR
jgi:hypothetical protein